MRTAAIPTGPARGEHFLPLRPGELIARLADDPAVTIFEREQFRQLCQLLAATIHHEYHARLEALKAAYAPFDPDADAIPLAPAAEPARERARCGELFALFDDLLAEAEEQELREVVLAWWLLWRGGLAGATPSQIDAAAERWLAEHCGLAADFEIADALAKLERLGLAHPRQAAQGSRRSPVAAPAAGHASAARWHPVSVEEALAALDRAWDALYHFEQPATIPLPAARVVPRRRAA